MKTRVLSAVVGIPIAVGIMILGSFYGIAVDIGFAIVASMCVFEGLSANKLDKKLTISVPCIAFCFIFCLFYSYNYVVPILTFVYVTALFLSMIFNHEHVVFPDLSYAFIITLMCTLGLWTVIYVFDHSSNIVGIFYAVTALATPWLADAAAYFGGSLLGKHKLCPKISPKKTVEGAVSGVIAGALLSLLIGVVFEKFFFKTGEVVNYFSLGLFGLLGSIISIIGDLSFSLIKRSIGVKDYGSLIPGHGGMLDRFDSVIFSSPVMMIIVMFMPIVSGRLG